MNPHRLAHLIRLPSPWNRPKRPKRMFERPKTHNLRIERMLAACTLTGHPLPQKSKCCQKSVPRVKSFGYFPCKHVVPVYVWFYYDSFGIRMCVGLFFCVCSMRANKHLSIEDRAKLSCSVRRTAEKQASKRTRATCDDIVGDMWSTHTRIRAL